MTSPPARTGSRDMRVGSAGGPADLSAETARGGPCGPPLGESFRIRLVDYQTPPVLQPPLPAVAQERLSVPVVLSRVIVNVLPDFEYAVIA